MNEQRKKKPTSTRAVFRRKSDTIMSTPSQEVLFYARCQLEGMIAENVDRQQKGQAIAYKEDAFLQLAEETRGYFREAQQYDTNN